MSADISQPVVLDATVLSNFASTETVGWLVETFDQLATVPAVRAELEQGVQMYEFLDDALDHIGDDISVLGTDGSSGTEKKAIRSRLDSGEAESLLAARGHDGTVATDDLAARDVASEYGIPVTGSVGLLVVGIQRDTVNISTANQWLDDWQRTRGYYAPAERLEELLD